MSASDMKTGMLDTKTRSGNMNNSGKKNMYSRTQFSDEVPTTDWMCSPLVWSRLVCNRLRAAGRCVVGSCACV